MDKYHDEITKTLSWKVSNLKTLQIAITRYMELLAPHQSPSNNKINKELSDMRKISQHIRNKIAEAEDNGDMVDLPLYGKNYGKLYDILWKYHSYKNQLLEEKKKVTLVEAALEGETEELEQVKQMLSHAVWEKFTRHKALVDSFYGVTPPKTNDPVVQQFFNVETLNGILAGTNTGTIIQNNENKEVLNALKELATILKEGHITDQYTAQALGNIRDFQAELFNPFPDKSKLQKAAEGLQVLANFSQLASFTIAITPHLHIISQFVANLR